MDKVKIVLDVLKKHHFWVLIGLILFLGLLIYGIAVASLRSEYTERAEKLDNDLTATKEIAFEVDHPNADRIKNLKSKKRQQEQKVNEAWRILYRQQKEANPWPVILGKEFLDMIRRLELGQEIPYNYRGIYWNEIEKALPELFEIVDYRHEVLVDPEEGADENEPGGGGPAVPGGRNDVMGSSHRTNRKTVGIVNWDDDDRQRIGREFNWFTVPSDHRVRLAQEDYWVYRALLTIIKKTNGEATTHSGAAVKRIIALEIGKTAAKNIASSQGPSLVATSGTGTAGDPGAMGSGVPFGGAGFEGAPTMRGMDRGESDDALLDCRYVKQDMVPLTTGETAPYTEFKMMPVRMELMIDQHRIPELLVQCANSTMPVEVVRLRINPGETKMSGPRHGGMHGGMHGSGGFGTGGHAMAEGLEGGTGMGGEGEFGGGEFGGRPSPLGSSNEEDDPYKVILEIRGIIYIYNPPPTEAGQPAVERTGDAATTSLPQPSLTNEPQPSKPAETTQDVEADPATTTQREPAPAGP